MKIAFFDTHSFEKNIFIKENISHKHEFVFIESRLTESTASLAKNFPCVCAFVNDQLNEKVLKILSEGGTKLIALRCAGFNHVDLNAAEKYGLSIVRVPEYSPHAVAEHALALLLALNRKLPRAFNRVREGNFSLDGLVGFDLHGRTIGVVGTGKIGKVFAKILIALGCKVLAYDQEPNQELIKIGVSYVSLEEIFKKSKVVSLHLPLTPETKHLIDTKLFNLAPAGLMIVNTSRGGLIDTKALIRALKSGHLGGAALDVYEEEEGIFFKNLSEQILQDDQLARLLTFPNVILTAHQAFLTEDALQNIAHTTLENISYVEKGHEPKNSVHAQTHHHK